MRRFKKGTYELIDALDVNIKSEHQMPLPRGQRFPSPTRERWPDGQIRVGVDRSSLPCDFPRGR
jgi:hypothetical protein